MNELVEFQRLRIIALYDRVTELEQYVLELTDKDCPKEYKRIVRNEILTQNN
jgi:hypothetical protein